MSMVARDTAVKNKPRVSYQVLSLRNRWPKVSAVSPMLIARGLQNCAKSLRKIDVTASINPVSFVETAQAHVNFPAKGRLMPSATQALTHVIQLESTVDVHS
jgi:hypothetical protein